MIPEPKTEPITGMGSGAGTIQGAALSSSWLADMAIGGDSSIATKPSLAFQYASILTFNVVLSLVLS